MALAGGLFVKLDPKFIFHRKAVAVGPFGRLLYISALGYCVESLSDGFIPSRVTSRVADVDDPDPAQSVRALVDAKLWLETDGGYMVKDYLDWQPSAKDIDRKRQQYKRRQTTYRKRVSNASQQGEANADVTRLEKRREEKRINNNKGVAAHSKSFTPPKVSEVADFCSARANGIDAEAFVAHYAANGWRRGNTPVKDWKSCVITWEKRRTEASPQSDAAAIAAIRRRDAADNARMVNEGKKT